MVATAKRKHGAPTGRIRESTFDNKFKPVKNHLVKEERSWNDCMFETYGAEFAWVAEQPKDKVWTWIDGDSGNATFVVAGLCYVNRIGYFVTENPHTGVEYFKVC